MRIKFSDRIPAEEYVKVGIAPAKEGGVALFINGLKMPGVLSYKLVVDDRISPHLELRLLVNEYEDTRFDHGEG